MTDRELLDRKGHEVNDELAAAKADPNGRELSPAAQALYEAEGVARFAAMHGGRNRPWEWLDSPRGVLPSDGGQQ